jgi:hypothetical protein
MSSSIRSTSRRDMKTDISLNRKVSIGIKFDSFNWNMLRPTVHAGTELTLNGFRTRASERSLLRGPVNSISPVFKTG